MDYIHVKHKVTGHEYPVPSHLYDSEVHAKTNKATHTAHGDLVPTKFRTTVQKAASAKSAKSAAKSGQQAETEKE